MVRPRFELVQAAFGMGPVQRRLIDKPTERRCHRSVDSSIVSVSYLWSVTKRRVSELLKRDFWPLLESQGFEKGLEAREYVRLADDVLSVVRIATRPGEEGGDGSFDALVGVRYFATERALAAKPSDITLDHSICPIRARLTRTTVTSAVSPEIWKVTDLGIEAAVDDLVLSYVSQGMPFLEAWTDPASAFALIRDFPHEREAPEVSAGVATISASGNPGSINRNNTLATIAARLGDLEAEAAYLRSLVEAKFDGSAVVERLSYLTA